MMTTFEPIFILCVLATGIVLVLALVAAIQGKRAEALAKLRRLGICAALYAAVLLAVDLATPRKVYHVGDTQCFDDWCIAVVSATRVRPESVEVSLRLSSRAKRRPMGEKGTVAYLIDSRGRRYNPIHDSVTVPFSTRLQPGESVTATRRFEVPNDAKNLSLIYTHETWSPVGFSSVIGENEWFHGPPEVRLGS